MASHHSYNADREAQKTWPRSTSGTAMRILVIEDDDKTADYIVRGLSECGYVADRASDGHDGLHLATAANTMR